MGAGRRIWRAWYGRAGCRSGGLRSGDAAAREYDQAGVEREAAKIVQAWEGVPAMEWRVCRRAQSLVRALPTLRGLSENPDQIPARAVSRKGSRYLFCDLPMTWHEARKFCSERGGHLVTIRSNGEDEFVNRLARGRFHAGFTVRGDSRPRWITGQDWTYGTTAGTLDTVSTDPARSFEPFQGRALRVKVPDGRHTGMNVGYDFADELGYEPEEIFFRYYVRFSDDWHPIQTTPASKRPRTNIRNWSKTLKGEQEKTSGEAP